MKLGVITLSRSEAKQNQYYNAQDMGLARALKEKGHWVTVYRLTKDFEGENLTEGIRIVSVKAGGFGRQSLCGFDFLEKDLERLICFSDNQISYPSLFEWCVKNKVQLLPYVGVIQSNSSKKPIQMLTNAMVERNLKRYRRQKVYGKTPDILEDLRKKGCLDTALVPVCLDMHRLKADYESFEKGELRKEWGFHREEKVILFIGRLEPEKEPLEMLEIAADLAQKNEDYKLLIVGKGSLEAVIRGKADELGLTDKVTLLPQVPNQDIWKLYRISDCFVNLNHHEIYGMSILEALYYNCPVVAWSAPGPEFILNHGEAGRLCKDSDEIKKAVGEVCEKNGADKTKEYLLGRLSWEKVCGRFLD